MGSLLFYLQYRRKRDGTLCYETDVTTVLVSLETMKSVPITDEFCNKISGQLKFCCIFVILCTKINNKIGLFFCCGQTELSDINKNAKVRIEGDMIFNFPLDLFYT